MSFQSEFFVYREPLVVFPERCLICDVCNRAVKIETAVTNEYGQAVHPACYLAALKGSGKRV